VASYTGFSGLVSKLEAKGKSPAQAKGIAAKVGMAKYGKKKFEAAAKAGRKLGHKKSMGGQ
jgi:hypothetical protein